MENTLTDGHYLSLYICKCCKQFDALNFDGLAGKHQKRQNFLRQNFVLYGSITIIVTVVHICIVLCTHMSLGVLNFVEFFNLWTISIDDFRSY